ncbi:MAG: nucleotidyltransferase domain-containing protein [Thioploca sp.]|nr:nucleotidyltransferase domain-containing protein [Thioploca sp.]
MRLDTHQQQALRTALQRIDGENYIFGSRIDDCKRSGDIDILIFSTEEPYYLRQQIHQRIVSKYEEKLDIVILNPAKLNEEQAAFLAVNEKQPLQLRLSKLYKFSPMRRVIKQNILLRHCWLRAPQLPRLTQCVITL